MIATTLQCLSCGAAVAKRIPNCGHCGARVQTRSCPGCFGMMSPDCRHCPHCGAAAETWESSETPLRCPSCTVNLRAGTLGNARLHECPRCCGVWLDPATLERLARDADQQSVLLAGASIPGITACSGASEPAFYRPCAVCCERMLRVNYARSSGVIVDVCRVHGTWLDADELHRVMRFIQRGGLQWVRAREQADLAAERRLLEATRAASLFEPATRRTVEYQVTEALCEFGFQALWEWLSH